MSTRHTYDVLRSAMLAGLLLWSGVSAAQEPAARRRRLRGFAERLGPRTAPADSRVAGGGD